LEIYECGEPTIGSSFVQFDLRFYVVALLFIIFDVEVAFFFPWATVFGKSTHLMRPDMVVVEGSGEGGSGSLRLTADGEALYREFGVRNPEATATVPESLRHQVSYSNEIQRANDIAHAGARQLALVSIVDILVFFAVLIVGFLYVWHRGDLDWVRASGRPRLVNRPMDFSESELEDSERALSV
jgi:NADH-quinone oxidoreductase subunit A